MHKFIWSIEELIVGLAGLNVSMVIGGDKIGTKITPCINCLSVKTEFIYILMEYSIEKYNDLSRSRI